MLSYATFWHVQLKTQGCVIFFWNEIALILHFRLIVILLKQNDICCCFRSYPKTFLTTWKLFSSRSQTAKTISIQNPSLTQENSRWLLRELAGNYVVTRKRLPIIEIQILLLEEYSDSAYPRRTVRILAESLLSSEIEIDLERSESFRLAHRQWDKKTLSRNYNH